MPTPRVRLDYRFLAGLFLAFVVLQELFWFSLSRLLVTPFRSYYHVADIEFFEVLLFFSLLFLFSLFYFCFACCLRPLPKFKVKPVAFLFITNLSVLFNVALFLYLPDRARYESGGLSGINGVLYYASFFLNIFVSVIYARHGLAGLPKGALKYAFYFFLMSLLLRADGMASVLFVFCLLVIYRGFRSFSLGGIFLVFVAGFCALYIGIVAKWSEIPDYMSLDFFIRWVIARFSIQAEQAYIYSSGESLLGLGFCSFCDILYDTVNNRLIFSGLISGEYSYPRSVSEALYFDLNGEFGSGSSPGLFLGTLILGPFAPLAMLLISFVFVNFFYRANNISVFYFPFLAFFSKGVHTNVTEFIVVLSPIWISFILFLVASLIEVRSSSSESC